MKHTPNLNRATIQVFRGRDGIERHSAWTPELAAKCRELYRDKGMGPTAVARELGPQFTKNMVTGYCIRRGWKRSAEVAQQNRREAGRVSGQNGKANLPPFRVGSDGVRVFPQPAPKPLPDSASFQMTSTAKLWTERGPGECAWPVGVPDVPTLQMSCCAKTKGKRYCPAHLNASAFKGGYGIMAPGEEALIRAVKGVLNA